MEITGFISFVKSIAEVFAAGICIGFIAGVCLARKQQSRSPRKS